MKLRGTVAPWLVLAVPAFVAMLSLAGLFGSRFVPQGTPSTLWPELLQGGWVFLFWLSVPAFVSIEAAYLANVEHSGKSWKQLFAYPVPRWSVYAVKMVVSALLTAAAIIVGVVALTLAVLLYGSVYDLHLAGAVPWELLLRTVCKAWLASWLMIAIQSWVSTRIRGLGAGIGLTLAALLVGSIMLRPADGAMMSYYPWTMVARTLAGTNRFDLHDTTMPAIVGALGGLTPAAWACWDLGRRRDVG